MMFELPLVDVIKFNMIIVYSSFFYLYNVNNIIKHIFIKNYKKNSRLDLSFFFVNNLRNFISIYISILFDT